MNRFGNHPDNDFGPWKNHVGAYLTQSLFFEYRTVQDCGMAKSIYSLKKEDHTDNAGKEYKSLFLLYMNEEDPTEYTFALKYFANWEHWQLLCKTSWFKPVIAEWRLELELRLRAKALLSIKELAKGGKDALAANRILLNGGWKPQGKGRPTAEQIERKAEELVNETIDVNDDAARLGLRELN